MELNLIKGSRYAAPKYCLWLLKPVLSGMIARNLDNKISHVA